MHTFPPLPTSAGESPVSGHYWALEWVDGGLCRFRLDDSGTLVFGDEQTRFDGDVPLPYQRTVMHVRETIDREALHSAADDVTGITFFGLSTHRRRVEYDWDRLPPFLGFEIWSDSQGRFVPPDMAERVYDVLGLSTLPVLEKEVDATYTPPDEYPFVDSEWREGDVAGLLFRDKTDGRLVRENADLLEGDAERDATSLDAETFARERATDERFDSVAAELEERGWPVTHDTMFDRVVADVAREQAHVLGDASGFDENAFRSAVAERLQRYLHSR